MKKNITVLLLMLAITINAQQAKQFERTYKYMRITEPNKVKGSWTNGSFGLMLNFENQFDKIQLVIEKATLLFRVIGLTKTSKTDEGIEYQEAKLESIDGKTFIIKLYPKEAQIIYSDGSAFEFSNLIF